MVFPVLRLRHQPQEREYQVLLVVVVAEPVPRRMHRRRLILPRLPLERRLLFQRLAWLDHRHARFLQS